jgi:hypothetical protein
VTPANPPPTEPGGPTVPARQHWGGAPTNPGRAAAAESGGAMVPARRLAQEKTESSQAKRASQEGRAASADAHGRSLQPSVLKFRTWQAGERGGAEWGQADRYAASP